MATSLEDLLSVPTVSEAVDLVVLPELRAERDGVALAVTDWTPGGALRSASYGGAALHVEARKLIAAHAASRFGDYVFGYLPHPSGIDVTDWCTAVAAEVGVKRIEATHTKRRIRLTNAVAAAYGPLTAGDVVIRFSSTGNRYVLAEDADQAGGLPVTIPSNGATPPYVDAVFRSEFTVDSKATPARNYGDGSSATIEIVTGDFPGVTATNPGSAFTSVSQIGSGTGTITPSGTPGGGWSTSSWQVRIDSSGQRGTASWSYRYKQSATAALSAWVSAGAVNAVANAAGSGITITLADGSGTPSFVARDKYLFAAPGSDVVQVGRDIETPQELGARVRAVWPLFASAKDGRGNWIPTGPTMTAYEALAREASTQIKICLVRSSTTINNRIHILIAGQGATLDPSVLATVEAYLDRFGILGDNISVESPTTDPITIADATITVRKAQLAAAQLYVDNAVRAYIGGVDPNRLLTMGGGDAPVIDRGWLIHLLESAPGVTGLTDETLTINGAAADYALATDNLAIVASGWTAANGLTWATV